MLLAMRSLLWKSETVVTPQIWGGAPVAWHPPLSVRHWSAPKPLAATAEPAGCTLTIECGKATVVAIRNPTDEELLLILSEIA
jgi:hypothetical protein